MYINSFKIIEELFLWSLQYHKWWNRWKCSSDSLIDDWHYQRKEYILFFYGNNLRYTTKATLGFLNLFCISSVKSLLEKLYEKQTIEVSWLYKTHSILRESADVFGPLDYNQRSHILYKKLSDYVTWHWIVFKKVLKEYKDFKKLLISHGNMQIQGNSSFTETQSAIKSIIKWRSSMWTMA